MKKVLIIGALSLIALLCSGKAHAAPADRTNSNQILHIQVKDHPRLSGPYTINPDGVINYDFLKKIKVLRMNKEEVEAKLTKILSKHIVNPSVTVDWLKNARTGKFVYVAGHVAQPSRIHVTNETITVKEALNQAGQPLATANLEEVILMTHQPNGEAKRKTINLQAMLHEGDLSQNHAMNPGDVLYVPANLNDKLKKPIHPLQPVYGISQK